MIIVTTIFKTSNASQTNTDHRPRSATQDLRDLVRDGLLHFLAPARVISITVIINGMTTMIITILSLLCYY